MDSVRNALYWIVGVIFFVGIKMALNPGAYSTSSAKIAYQKSFAAGCLSTSRIEFPEIPDVCPLSFSMLDTNSRGAQFFGDNESLVNATTNRYAPRTNHFSPNFCC